ncbi:NEDD1-like protein [Mya arenaria]|uniref:NEDD1-like protein n=1 Tax=Mya arenaria TaxID=6604 RepID=A0ABY7FVI7_MYAAR|nr:protein NEDD1-like [Mya arenaria]XP_052780888.1 protein NEDD1-like [Mya arenaria]XP_052780889.1 protein NEDD1-like [Mya arenaria]XP_052780890.1 protein NEDD1-like [Mya arenaria]WAR25077.1 NEDD1-like protein [Mya arenaria]
MTSNMNMQLVSAGDDIKIWDCNDFILEHQFNPHDENVTSVCWAADNSFLASGSVHSDNVVITDVKTWEKSFLKCDAGCMCLDVNDTSRYMLTGGSNGIISVWDSKTRKIRKTYKDHKGPVTCARFNQGTTSIASGSETGEIILYNVVTGQGCRPLLSPNVQSIRQVQFGRKKSQLGSVSDDGAVCLWDCNRRQLLHTFDCHRAPATGLSFSPINDIFLVSVGLDKRIACHDVQTKKVVKVINTDSPLTSIDTMSNGITIAVGTTRGQILNYDLRMASVPVNFLDAHKSSVQGLRFQTEAKSESGSGKPTSAANKQLKHRQLPSSPRNVGVALSELRTPRSDVDIDVFSPLREGFQDSGGEDSESRGSSEGLVSSSGALRQTSGDMYAGGVFSPLHDPVGGRDSSGAGLSPLAYPGYGSPATQIRKSPVLTSIENRINTQVSAPQINIFGATPQTTKYHITDPLPHTSLTNGDTVFDHTSKATNARNVNFSAHNNERQHSHQKQVAFDNELRTYPVSDSDGSPQFSNSHRSPDLSRLSENHQVGISASPSLPTVHFGDSSGNSQEGANGAEKHYPTTPEGVSAQSEGSNKSDTYTDHKQKSLSTNLSEARIAQIVRSVVQEELNSFKGEMRGVFRDELEETVDQLHRDIVNLQSAMLVEFFKLQSEIVHLLEQYSLNPELLEEISRLQDENKRFRKIY